MEVSIFEWTDFFSFSVLKIDAVWVKKFKVLEDLKEVILKYDKSTQKKLFTQLKLEEQLSSLPLNSASVQSIEAPRPLHTELHCLNVTSQVIYWTYPLHSSGRNRQD